MICSEYKVTLGALSNSPLVILNYDDEIERELMPTRSRVGELVPFVRGAAAKGYGRSNYSHEIKFSRKIEFNDPASTTAVEDSRDALFDRFDDIPADGGSVLVEIRNGNGYLFHDCLVESIPSGLANATRTFEKWEIVAGAMISLGTSGISPLEILDDNGDNVLDGDGDNLHATALLTVSAKRAAVLALAPDVWLEPGKYAGGTWTDTSGNAKHATAVEDGDILTNIAGGVTLDGVDGNDSYLTTAHTPPVAGFTIFAVGKRVAQSTSGSVTTRSLVATDVASLKIGGINTNKEDIAGKQERLHALSTDGTQDVSASFENTERAAFCLVNPTATTGGALWKNGVKVAHFNSVLETNTDPIQIGGASNESENRFAGDLDEIIVFDSILSAANIATVFALLLDRHTISNPTGGGDKGLNLISELNTRVGWDNYAAVILKDNWNHGTGTGSEAIESRGGLLPENVNGDTLGTVVWHDDGLDCQGGGIEFEDLAVDAAPHWIGCSEFISDVAPAPDNPSAPIIWIEDSGGTDNFLFSYTGSIPGENWIIGAQGTSSPRIGGTDMTFSTGVRVNGFGSIGTLDVFVNGVRLVASKAYVSGTNFLMTPLQSGTSGGISWTVGGTPGVGSFDGRLIATYTTKIIVDDVDRVAIATAMAAL